MSFARLINYFGPVVLIGGLATIAACASPTEPVPSISGEWLGGAPVQLAVSFTQTRQMVDASGQLARAGTFSGFVLQTNGVGLIRPDSTLTINLRGQAGNHLLQAKLLPDGTISGSIEGDRIGAAAQVIVLTRHAIRV